MRRVLCGRPIAGACIVAVAITLFACAEMQKKEELEAAAKNTIVCQLAGERLLIRYERDEARLLMPSGDRVTLYQVRSGSSPRYSNGLMELRGKGMELELLRDDASMLLVDCGPYTPPK